MKEPVKEKIFHIIKIVIAIILALAMIASVAATMVQGSESVVHPSAGQEVHYFS